MFDIAKAAAEEATKIATAEEAEQVVGDLHEAPTGPDEPQGSETNPAKMHMDETPAVVIIPAPPSEHRQPPPCRSFQARQG